MTTRNGRGVSVPSVVGSSDGLRDISSIGLIRSSVGEAACRLGAGISYSLDADAFRIESPSRSSERPEGNPPKPIGGWTTGVRSFVEGRLVAKPPSASGDRPKPDPARDSSSEGRDRVRENDCSLGVPSYFELWALAIDEEDAERVVLNTVGGAKSVGCGRGDLWEEAPDGRRSPIPNVSSGEVSRLTSIWRSDCRTGGRRVPAY